MRLELDAASDKNIAFAVRLRFIYGTRKQKGFYVLRPYLYPDAGTDFFALEIPAASTACEIQLRFSENAQRVAFNGFRVVVENASAQ